MRDSIWAMICFISIGLLINTVVIKDRIMTAEDRLDAIETAIVSQDHTISEWSRKIGLTDAYLEAWRGELNRRAGGTQ